MIWLTVALVVASVPGSSSESARLGVRVRAVAEQTAATSGLESTRGALVVGVDPGSPALRGGLRVGDVILAVDGHLVEHARALGGLVGRAAHKRQFAVTVWRDRQTVDLSFGADAISPGISRAGYIRGGVVGTAFGFGLGHLAIGEYDSLGWVFTTFDLVAWGATAYGPISVALEGIFTPTEHAECGSPAEQAVCNERPSSAFLIGGLIAVLLSRAWQGIDLWMRPTVAAPVRGPSAVATWGVAPVRIGTANGVGFALVS